MLKIALLHAPHPTASDKALKAGVERCCVRCAPACMCVTSYGETISM